jgi:hypothetical protein
VIDNKVLLRIVELTQQRQAIDAELETLIAGETTKGPKPRVCKNCGLEGHNAKGCPQKQLPLQS